MDVWHPGEICIYIYIQLYTYTPICIYFYLPIWSMILDDCWCMIYRTCRNSYCNRDANASHGNRLWHHGLDKQLLNRCWPLKMAPIRKNSYHWSIEMGYMLWYTINGIYIYIHIYIYHKIDIKVIDIQSIIPLIYCGFISMGCDLRVKWGTRGATALYTTNEKWDIERNAMGVTPTTRRKIGATPTVRV